MNIMVTTNETIRAYSMNDFCRLCANLDDNMVSIYSGEGLVHMLENKIKTHLPFINISKDDLLPKRICYHCASTVLVWNELYETTSGADQKLRNMFEANQYDEDNNCKNAEYEEMHLPVVPDSLEYEEINIFNKDVKSNKTNELDKVASTSSTDILNHGHKSSDIEGTEKLNPVLKSEIFSDDVEDDEHNVFLNSAGVSSGDENVMDCHTMDVSTADDCSGLVPKREYINGDTVDGVDESAAGPAPVTGTTAKRRCLRLRLSDADSNAASTSDVDTESGDLVNRRQITDRAAGSRRRPAVVLNAAVGDDDDDDDDDDGDGDVDDPDENNSSCYNNEDEENENENEDENEDEDEDEDEDDNEPGALEVRQLYVKVNANGDEEEEAEETMCQLCATVFKTRYNLLRHFQKRHPEYKMYECDLCRISFQTIDEFKDHLDEKHSKVQTASKQVDSKQVRFACDVCGNMYKNKASAMNHLLTHTAKKDVACPHCDFTCYTKQQLGVHQTKHDKRFVCDICNKRFAQKSQLDVHVKAVHYNQRPYCCVLCSKSFKTKGSHDAHMIVHTDTRNYQCPHCDKKCRKRYDLTLHIRTHTGEKPFKCSVCGRGFVQMCDTRKHELLHFRKNKKSTLFFSTPSNSAPAEEDE